MKGKDLLWMVAAATTYVLGVGTGVLISKGWMEEKYKRHYKTVADEEIESVKRAFSKMKKPSPEKKDGGKTVPFPIQVEVTRQYHDMVREERYSDREDERPRVISPEEFGEMGDYETLSLTYFSDGILVDDSNQIIADPDGLIGVGSLERFGEYEEDSVYVRNGKLRCDFEILLDERSYSEAMQFMPPT